MRSPHLSLLAVLTLAACAPAGSYWSEAQSPKRNQVEMVRLNHDVALPASGALAPAQAAALDAFLARHDIGFGDQVTVAAANSNPAAVSAYLRKQGIVADAGDANGIPAGAARVQVERHVIVPPNCPDWRKPGTADYGNAPMGNLGCATAVNFGLMLADPRDLIQGRAPGDADGTAAAAAMQRYRADKVKALPKGSTTE
ncbi:MAG: CpaD family pilus assembly lipoprotein [Alphaproteobacteria bacterium]